MVWRSSWRSRQTRISILFHEWNLRCHTSEVSGLWWQNHKTQWIQKKGKQTSSFLHQTSDISVAAVPVYLQSVSNLCNQLLRSGTSIGANNAEACNAITKSDFKSKSYIALKEARESLYWIDLLHRNGYLTDKQHNSLYNDCEELVKILVHRCKKLDGAE